jgi:hypothetical protein
LSCDEHPSRNPCHPIRNGIGLGARNATRLLFLAGVLALLLQLHDVRVP